MVEIDRITNDAKTAIISILNTGLAIEYTHIINYPRFIDQMVNINEVAADDPSVVVLKQLGEESVRHDNIVMALITQLGGKPQLGFEPAARMTAVLEMCQQQMEKEKENQAIFQEAKMIAQNNQVKTLKGILDENINMIRGRSPDALTRSQMIQLLTGLENGESRHMKLLETVISDLNRHKAKSEG